MKDSDLWVSPVRVRKRWLMTGRAGLAEMAGPGGVTSGVGGFCWFGGVDGGAGVDTFSRLSSGVVTHVGLDGCMDWVLDELLECVGGVGGISGPLPILFG